MRAGYLVLVLFLFAVAFLPAAVSAQTTAFSYQGALTDQGSPGNGNYDMAFKLYDSLVGTNQIGPTVTINSVHVANGIFAVKLDFGLGPFSGPDRYIEISVRPPQGSFTVLTPRTQILSSPYALRAATVTGPVNATSSTAALVVTNDQPGNPDPSFKNPPPAALKAEATSNVDTNAGIVAVTNGSGGIGLLAITNGSGAAPGKTFGVVGISTTTSGRGAGLSAVSMSPDSNAIEADAENGGLIFKGVSNDPSSSNPKFAVTSTGQVTANGGLNTSTIMTTGDVSVGGNGIVGGTWQVSTLPSGGNAPLCTLGTAANVIRFCSSSLRYKKDVHPFDQGLNVVNRLRPIAFKWKENGAADVGLGAEDVAKVDPRLTFQNNKGQVEGVKYGQLNVVLINAIKEQQEQIELLRAQNAALSIRLRAVEKRIRKMGRR
jgi:hypothetical protein